MNIQMYAYFYTTIESFLFDHVSTTYPFLA